MLVYLLVPAKARLGWLLAASYYFYMSWNPEYAFLILISTVTTWGSALFLCRWRQQSEKRPERAPVALRNVAFIISRKGFDSNAQKASLGCLKESGKLIISLDDDDLIKMIYMKENGEEPSDYL